MLARLLTKTTISKPERTQATTKDYLVAIQRIRSPALLGGEDWMYSIINKKTAVVEYRTSNLPDALDVLTKMQSHLELAKTNGSGTLTIE